MANLRTMISSPMRLLLLVACTLSACTMPAEVSVSLSEPGQADFDTKLLGHWYALDENGDTIMIVSARESDEGPARGDFLMLENNGIYGGTARIRGQVHASEIEGERYYNIQRMEDNFAEDGSERGKSDSFIIAKLKVGDDGVLSIKTLDGGYLEELVESGEVKGHEEKGDPYGDYLVLDVTRDELIALIREHPEDKLFGFFDSQDIRTVFRRLDHTYSNP